ncbi:sigma factor [Micromonospora sp. NPDC005215]|uniref:sigma factor n=1 Tax=Micromonospora sp. NPDC005215 TaxID=3157024 RepID=UPI0033BE27D8
MRDAQSFDDFYRSTARRMARYGYAVAGDHTEAQDLVQEAYTRAWRHWGRLAVHPAPEAWLRLVVSRLATDRWRRLRSWREALRLAGPPPAVGPPTEDSVLLLQALPSGPGLTDLCRAAIRRIRMSFCGARGWCATVSEATRGGAAR